MVYELTLLAAFLGVFLFAFQALADPTPARQSELMHRLLQDCGACHGMTLKGGLGPSLLPVALAGKEEQALVETILEGRPGTPMPPWKTEISPDEAMWMVLLLKSGIKNVR